MAENILDKRDRSIAPNPGGKGSPKVEKFNWAKPTTPGVFAEIRKNELNIDGEYQRDKVSESKVLDIARSWDWALFGAVKVAIRNDGYWVFDGGHRVRAAFYRHDIDKLPCLVFEMEDVSDEARVFVAGAKLSSAISAIDTFRASRVSREPVAVEVSAMLDRLNLKVNRSPANSSQIKCIGTISAMVKEDASHAEASLITAKMLAGESPILSDVLKAIFRLGRHFKPRDVLNEFDDSLSKLTQAEIEQAIRVMRIEYGKGGDVVAAKALMVLLNKGKRSRRLEW